MSNKIALVTGSSRGIGAAIAVRLAKDGYDIAINYIKRKDKAKEVLEKIESLGRRVIAIQADVSDRKQVDRMFDTIRRELGEVEVLVSNAGIADMQQVQDITFEHWKRYFAVNVDGAFNTIQCALPHMLHEHRGCIITIASIWGIRGASCESAYSATKAAVIGFSRSLARELGPSGIRVNSIAPGAIDTDMLSGIPRESLDFFAEETPLQRLGSPEDIASVVSFLASENASFMTGQVITNDGGYVV